MEEKISTAESRGAIPGFLLQSFLNALQQRNQKTTVNSSKPNNKSSTIDFKFCPSNANKRFASCSGDVDETEIKKDSLTTTQKKINHAWERYSPVLKDKVLKYSPGAFRKLKTLFSVTEKDSNYEVCGMESGETTNEIKQRDDRKRANVNSCSNEDGISFTKNDSSRKIEVPLTACDDYLLSSPGFPAINPVKAMDHPPYIILQEADSNENGIKEIDVHSEKFVSRKSPLNVQEWVDRIPLNDKVDEKDCEYFKSKDLDYLGTAADLFPQEEKKSLIAQKLSREVSIQSSSSLDSILDSRRPDPVEVLLNLGFGGVPGVDMNNCRIPKRFLVPSKCKGGDWNEFLRRELLQAQNFECASLGFRGLSGPSYRRPSAIVANIMEKLREQSNSCHSVKTRFSCVARRVLNEKSVLNKLVPPKQSVLSPDSRKFLENQGKISPEVPRRRIIFGQKSFAFGKDGEFIEIESTPTLRNSMKEPATSIDNSCTGSHFKERKVSTTTLSNPDILLRLRRSSLQRQKRIEEDPGDVNAFMDENEANITPELTQLKDFDDKNNAKKNPLVNFAASADAKQIPKKERSITSEEIKLEVEEEIKSLYRKIQNVSNTELKSILLQIKELRARLENSSKIIFEKS